MLGFGLANISRPLGSVANGLDHCASVTSDRAPASSFRLRGRVCRRDVVRGACAARARLRRRVRALEDRRRAARRLVRRRRRARRRSPAGSPRRRFGPKRAVVAGLILLAVASFAFAAAEGPWALGLARLVQGSSSTITWAGAFAWLTVATPRDRRGELIGTAFGAAVFGAILGPMFGAVADAVSVRVTFAVVGLVAAALAASQPLAPSSPPQKHSRRRRRARVRRPRLRRRPLAEHASRAPLRHARRARPAPARRGRLRAVRDRRRLPPGRAPRDGRQPVPRPLLRPARPPPPDPRSRSQGRSPSRSPSRSPATRTRSRSSPCSPRSRSGRSTRRGWRSSPTAPRSPGSRRRIGFGIMNTAWALGNMSGPALAGTIADAAGDGVPYVLAAALCPLTLAATARVSSRAGTVRAPT